jgi:prepilin-type N-terminal cleavage/methylation domain-containing protein
MDKTKITFKGFTLIEALIVVAIIGILSALTIVNIANSQITQKLESAAREVEAAVREAQGYALTGYQDVSNTDPCGFEISWTASSPTYNLKYYYKDSSDRCNQNSPIATYSLRNGITFSTTGSFSFAPPWAAPSFSQTSQVIPLTLSGASHSVCVYQSGLINNRIGTSCP